MKLSSLLFIFFFLIPSFLSAENTKRKLVIYSTKGFSVSWKNPKHPFKKQFEAECNCTVEFLALGGTSAILSKLMLEGKQSPADLVIGLDNNLIDKAEKLGLFTQHNLNMSNLTIPIKWDNQYLVPYDYGYLSFIYNSKKLKTPPSSIEDLANSPNIKIIMPDPRSSTLGLGLVAWIRLAYQERAVEIWQKLKQNIVTVTKSWSDGYNLFLKGEADMLLSYNSSPAYNMIAEDNYDIKAAEFSEGHYLQIELIGKLKLAKEPELADQFLSFVLSHSFQHSIPINNYMFPVIDIGEDLPKEYAKLFIPAKVFMTTPKQMQENRNLWIQEWLNTFSRK